MRVGPTDAILTPADGEAGTVNLHRLRIVSRYAVEAELTTGVLCALPVAGWTLTRPVSMVDRSQKYFSPAGERFRDFAKSYGAQHLEMGPQTRRAANDAPRGVRRAQPRG